MFYYLVKLRVVLLVKQCVFLLVKLYVSLLFQLCDFLLFKTAFFPVDKVQLTLFILPKLLVFRLGMLYAFPLVEVV